MMYNIHIVFMILLCITVPYFFVLHVFLKEIQMFKRLGLCICKNLLPVSVDVAMLECNLQHTTYT